MQANNRIMFCVLMNMLGIATAQVLSPTEVVEEWGCHDSIIRLTCGHLDSKIAVLEATFTPNCTALSEEECAHLDLKRLTRAYTSPLIDHHMAETEAGRKFLETLRKGHRSDIGDNGIAAGQSELMHDHHFHSLKAKRNSLRASLEQLIVQYLDGLSPDSSDYDDNFVDYSRLRRNSIFNETENITERYKEFNDNSNETTDDDDSEDGNVNESENYDENGVRNGDLEFVKKVEIGAVNITVPEIEYDNYVNKVDIYERVIRKKTICHHHRRRVAPLNQFEMDKSLQNESNYEHDIRRVLNYRCSGKNHCSFVFAIDHPFSIIWDSGIVHLKYACMQNFRLNQFCGEHLLVGDESMQPSSILQKEVKGEPVAEARISDQSFHHLKILKQSGGEQIHVPGSTDGQSQQKKEKLKNRKIYSQDFKILKILPSNLDDVNEIQQIGNEFYFKNQKTVQPLPSTEPPSIVDLFDNKQNEVELELPTEIVEKTVTIPKEILRTIHNDSDSSINTTNNNNVALQNSTIEEIISINATAMSSDIIESDLKNVSNEWEKEKLLEIGRNESNKEISNETIENIYDNSRIDLNYRQNRTVGYIGKSTVNPNEDLKTKDKYEDNSVITSSYENGEDIDSYGDYTVDYSDEKDSGKNKIQTHTGQQMTVMKPPLIQGFLATVGYPKFYIGESECSWKLTAIPGQKIQLTFLDINLRYDKICKDFVKIIDLDVGRVLFNNCVEYSKPFQILSDSNRLEIIVKTTSKVAYPKRGVLIHYSAFGCLLPPSPLNGRLVHKTEESAKYFCDPLFVFPDTAVSSRELICTVKRTWDKSLPNCIERSLVSNTGAITVSRFNHSKELPKMANNDLDMLYDVVIPSLVIAGLLTVNAIVLLVIMRYRSKRKHCHENEQQELAQL